jgi:hypothetical protein
MRPLPQHFNVRKNIKHWSREWKNDLIVASNPDWRDLMKILSADADDGLPGQARQ